MKKKKEKFELTQEQKKIVALGVKDLVLFGGGRHCGKTIIQRLRDGR